MKWGRTILRSAFVGVFFFLGITSGIVKGGTAFEAIQVLKREKGATIIKTICEIRGEQGTPQPENWIILLNDPLSRSGMREMVVSRGKIISDRTPIAEYRGVATLPVLNIESLRGDSDNAFQVANYQAMKCGAGFHWLDYQLNRKGEGREAVWKIRLFDSMGIPVGTVLVSAETGLVKEALKLSSSSQSTTQSNHKRAESYEEWVEGGGFIGHVNTATKNAVHSTKKAVNKTVKTTEKAAEKTKKSVLKVMGNTQEWWTGTRTIGPPVE